MPLAPAIIFLHRWPFQNYLKIALEQARVMNPGCPIYLLADRPCRLPSSWDIRQVQFDQLQSVESKRMETIYSHVSSNNPDFERFCFLRWFYLEELLKKEKLTAALHVDSDCLLTATAEEVFARFGQMPGIHICRNGLPHCAPLVGSLAPMLDYFLQAFAPEKIDGHKARMAAAKASGQAWVLSDMFVMRDYLEQGGAGSFYWYDTHRDVVITSVMSDAVGYQTWPGRRILKRVHWQVENGLLVPYLIEQATGRWVRAYALHYKGAAKKRISRFNPQNPILPATVRAWWHNHWAPVNGPRWVA